MEVGKLVKASKNVLNMIPLSDVANCNFNFCLVFVGSTRRLVGKYSV